MQTTQNQPKPTVVTPASKDQSSKDQCATKPAGACTDDKKSGSSDKK